MADPDSLRMFRLSVDVRSFKANNRLPMKAVNAFLKVTLPKEILHLAKEGSDHINASKLTAPLRTHPPLLVHKGSEILISNGYVALELPASVHGLATSLAQDPHLRAELFHRDKYAADSLIGVASIPMAPLMKEPLLDGHAPVYSTKNEDDDEQVNIGTLRVVLSAEELGPVQGPQKKGFKAIELTGNNVKNNVKDPSLEETFHILRKGLAQEQAMNGSVLKAVGVQADLKDVLNEDKKANRVSKKISNKSKVLSHDESSRKPSLPNGKVQGEKPEMQGASNTDGNQSKESFRKQPEYELAWEFEMWRRSEEAKWRADLKDKEAKRIAGIEAEMKQREKERNTAMENTRAELLSLETKLRTKLFSLEKRERALVLAEEAASMRRECLNREYSQRASDAEVAVKRLQSECDHRVELERSKYAALKEQYNTLEKRLASTNGSLIDLEKRFAAYKTEHSKSSEAELNAQLLLLRQQCSEWRQKAELAIRARNLHKTQVLKLAKQLASQRAEQDKGTTKYARDDGQVALVSLIQAQAMRNQQEKQELQHLKHQLQLLHLQQIKSTRETTKTEVVKFSDESIQVNLDASMPTENEGDALAPAKNHTHDSSEAKDILAPSLIHKVSDSIGDNQIGESPRNQGFDSHLTSIQIKDENRDKLSSPFVSVLPTHQSQPRMKHSSYSFSSDHPDGNKEVLSDPFSPAQQSDDILSQNTGLQHMIGIQEEDFDAPFANNNPEGYLEETKMNKIVYEDEDGGACGFSTCTLQLSAFQQSEIIRLMKQREELLSSGVYSENEGGIIKALDLEIERLKSVDVRRFGL